MSLFKLDIIVIITVVLVVIATDAKSNDGFYVMVGIGYNDSWFNDYDHGHGNWQSGDELGTDFGLGYRWNNPDLNASVDLSYRHKSQLGYNGGCDHGYYHCESSVDSIYLDLYWFPFGE